MRLATAELTGGIQRVVGLTKAGQIVDLAALSSALQIGPFGFPRDMLELVGAGRIAADFLRYCEQAISAGQAEKHAVSPDLIRWKAPIPRPTKVVCINSNRPNSKVDLLEPKWGGRWPRPQFFLKAPTAVVGHQEPILVERAMGRIQPEGELCLIIGRRAKRVSAEHALDYVAGAALLNDISASVFGLQDGVVLHIASKTGVEDFINRPMARAKGIDTFSPVGPWIVPLAELSSLNDIRITTSVSDRDGKSLMIQDGAIGDQRWTPAECLATVTEWMTLEPGDVVSLGAVSHVPGTFLRDIDLAEYAGGRIEIAATGIGTLSTPIRMVD